MDSDDEMFSNESEMKIMSKDWERIYQSRYNEGFINGSTQGQNEAIQSAFEAGFKQGFLSNYILSKIKGILSALSAYKASYEGNPITDSILFEAHILTEEISTLEANAVAEEFLKMSLQSSHSLPPNSQTSTEGLSEAFYEARIGGSSLSKSCDCENSTEACTSNRKSPEPCCRNSDTTMVTETNARSIETMTIEEVNSILLQCPQIMQTVNKCKRILKSLNWTDEMIDQLL